MNMNPTLLSQIQADIAAQFAAIGAKYGVKIKFGRGTYSPTNATLKLEIATIGAAGEVNSKEAAAFKMYASSYGLAPDDLGKTFKTFNGDYIIRGARPKAWKRPILGEQVKNGTPTGKVFIFPQNAVATGLGKKPLASNPYMPKDDSGESGVWEVAV